MRSWNKLNKVLISLVLSLAALSIIKIISYNASNRYYYTASVSNPEDFPIRILGTWFLLENGSFADASFYKTTDRVNAFYSDWGVSEHLEAHKPELLPESLFLEYIDYKTKNYYLATITLPKEKMKAAFKEAKESQHLKNLTSGGTKKGLEYHVGVANDGNIIFWLVGKNYETEFYRVKLEPKLFTNYIQAFEKEIEDKDAFFKEIFDASTDRIKERLKRKTDSRAQYKDSIPVYFKDFQG